ncbi:hypothetical protein EIN_153120 [Entamoeba invadens IP1]|uniref:Uncharacterized protein n=1 Tax=Entamoeba invadens IP1 TaxID=370355 RepID=A0A0A1U8Q6_ENTIV|nr:hypothetical protein EIN_153120 [Entamoeba invadens IP1]ELP91305.1 hypothetical protein EIN_153120 [Entamoeba invadens IP1]|eukprot:XP_004258076.1 hypothetical protein EIN_153120 [Entamoeba invadens IP1]
MKTMEKILLKDGTNIQFLITHNPENNINWESYHIKDHHTPDFIRYIIRNGSRLLFENTYRPINNSKCVNFLTTQTSCDSPSDMQIIEFLNSKYNFYNLEIDKINTIRFGAIYANPDECNSSQWMTILDVSNSFIERMNNDKNYVVIDTKYKDKMSKGVHVSLRFGVSSATRYERTTQYTLIHLYFVLPFKHFRPLLDLFDLM